MKFSPCELELLIESVTDKLAELEIRSDNGVPDLHDDINSCYGIIDILTDELYKYPSEPDPSEPDESH